MEPPLFHIVVNLKMMIAVVGPHKCREDTCTARVIVYAYGNGKYMWPRPTRRGKKKGQLSE